MKNESNEKTEVPTALERLFRILSGVFFGIAVLAVLVTVYVNTADDLSVSPLLFPPQSSRPTPKTRKVCHPPRKVCSNL